LSIHGYFRKKLTLDGAICACVLAIVVLLLDYGSSCALLSFYLFGSRITKVGASRKRKLESNYDSSSIRSSIQVAANSFPAAFTLLLCYKIIPMLFNINNTLTSSNTLIQFGKCFAMVYWCVCSGDTSSSELGILSKSQPRLVIPPWNKVPPGTNGGVTFGGFIASGIGGAVVGVMYFVGSFLEDPTVFTGSFVVSSIHFLNILLISTLSGVIGSLLDSILGATLQASWYDSKQKVIIESSMRQLQSRSTSNYSQSTQNLTEDSQHLILISGKSALLSNDEVNIISATSIAVTFSFLFHKSF